jgi:hypothetical protein
MSKRNVVNVIIAGLFVSAGAAHAANVFPTSTNEVSPTGYALSIESTREGTTGAMQPVFPAAAIEHGALRDSSYVATGSRVNRSIVDSSSVFPTSVNETGRL